MAGSSSQTHMALKTFDLTNNIQEIDPQDLIFKHDLKENKRINDEALWKKEYVEASLAG